MVSSNKPSGWLPTRRPAIWYNPQDECVYEWAGWPFNQTDPNYTTNWLWSFLPDGNGGAPWGSNPVTSSWDENGERLVPPFGASWTFSETSFYSLGGTILPKYDPKQQSLPDVPISGLVSNSFSSNAWNNQSSIGFSESSYSVLGEAAYVPIFGQNGLLIFLGGDSPSDQSYKYEQAAALADMSNITIFDIASEKWYHQTATGSIPPGRSEFCIVGTSASDNSSFEM